LAMSRNGPPIAGRAIMPGAPGPAPRARATGASGARSRAAIGTRIAPRSGPPIGGPGSRRRSARSMRGFGWRAIWTEGPGAAPSGAAARAILGMRSGVCDLGPDQRPQVRSGPLSTCTNCERV
jgi:hypothetical protein